MLLGLDRKTRVYKDSWGVKLYVLQILLLMILEGDPGTLLLFDSLGWLSLGEGKLGGVCMGMRLTVDCVFSEVDQCCSSQISVHTSVSNWYE